MNDVKLKLRPGQAGGGDWMAPSPLRQLFWNVTYTCNFRCAVCFSSSGCKTPDELTTDEAKDLVRNAHAAGVEDVVISGGEPLCREDLIEILALMGQLGITARIASNGSLLTEAVIRRLRRETLTKSFQVSLDTLDPDIYERVHKAPAAMLETALRALRCIKAEGFHTTISVRLVPETLEGIPALLDLASREGWGTVTIHCPVHSGRMEGAWPLETDLVALLEPVFDYFMRLPEHWIVETNIPWARYHKTIRALSKRIRVVHAGCRAARTRLAIDASGWITPCICVRQPEFRMGNVREDNLETVFRTSPIAEMLRHPESHGICADCEYVKTCGGGCRVNAFGYGHRIDAVDESCPIRRSRRQEKRADE